MPIGRVKWFSLEKGFGFISSEEGEDVYLAASACFEFGSVEDAVRLLRHTLWIHPGHRHARRDLSALNLYLRDRDEREGEMSADESFDAVQAASGDPELMFDIAGDEFDVPFGGDDQDTPFTDEGEDRAA